MPTVHCYNCPTPDECRTKLYCLRLTEPLTVLPDKPAPQGLDLSQPAQALSLAAAAFAAELRARTRGKTDNPHFIVSIYFLEGMPIIRYRCANFNAPSAIVRGDTIEATLEEFCSYLTEWPETRP